MLTARPPTTPPPASPTTAPASPTKEPIVHGKQLSRHATAKRIKSPGHPTTPRGAPLRQPVAATSSLSSSSSSSFFAVAGNLLDSTFFDESPFAPFEDETFDHSRARELDPSELDEEESTVYDVTCQTLSALQDNEDIRERICNNLSQELKNSYGYDVEDLGIDPTIYANKLLGNFTYQIESVYAFSDNEDPADNRGTAFFDYFVPSAYDFDETFHEELSEYLYDEGLSSAHGQLTDAQKERVREIYNDALNEIENDDTESSYGSLEFSYDGASNTFGLKEQSFNELVDSAFQLF